MVATADSSRQFESSHIEHYDVEDAIDAVVGLGKQLREETNSAVHRFRMDWVDQLVARYRANPGRPVVHLSDFLGHAQLHLRPEARRLVEPYWKQLASRDGR